MLRDEYDIQIEFGDMGNILAYISVGDRKRDIERLVSALAEIRRARRKPKRGMFAREFITPQVALTPQEAFYAPKESVPLAKAAGRVACEFVMCYPPGIPILAAGEMITPDIVEYIKYAKSKGCQITGTQDLSVSYINVLKD